jgi:hypothetical protein
MHFRPVDAGCANSHQDLARAGFRIAVFLNNYLLVADRDCTHGAAILCIAVTRGKLSYWAES